MTTRPPAFSSMSQSTGERHMQFSMRCLYVNIFCCMLVGMISTAAQIISKALENTLVLRRYVTTTGFLQGLD